MKYLIKFSYDGSKYFGFQRQKNRINIQSQLEEALSGILNEEINIKGAGRTDRNVHAIMQCAHFTSNNAINKERLLYYLQRKLKPYIYVYSINEVDDNFHARFSVKEKTYVYKINSGTYDPLLANYVLQDVHVSMSKLKKVAKIFKGTHDFTNFVSGARDNSTSIIYDIKVKRKKEIIYIYFRGKSFYRYMVRNLVGAMLCYCNDKITLEEIKTMLNCPNVKKQTETAPAQGLYLLNIKY